ncbi:hypothetical protein BJ741DRAFT_585814 [Chytriomyces cf. hyalinus JEL632]|nr:hypothetical protein BJ741DRAFT_585814 [Chytriomyces cf. hyalinus JEL632]
MTNRAPLECLPLELLIDIFLYLPVDLGITHLAVSSPMFAPLLLSDVSFAARHVARDIALCGHLHFFAHITTDLRVLPVPYLICALRVRFQDPFRSFIQGWYEAFFCKNGHLQRVVENLPSRYVRDQNGCLRSRSRALRPTDGECWLDVSRVHGDKIVSYLWDNGGLDCMGLGRLLDWLCVWNESEGATLKVLEHGNKDVCFSPLFQMRAVSLGWCKVMQKILGGYIYSHSQLLQEAISNQNSEMAAILLENLGIDSAFDGFPLFRSCRDLDFLQTLSSDPRLPNGKFLRAVLAGRVDEVKSYLALPKFDAAACPNSLCVMFAVRFDKPQVLSILLKDKRVRPITSQLIYFIEETIRNKNHSICKILITMTRFTVPREYWKLLHFICRNGALDMFVAMTSRLKAQFFTDCSKWHFVLRHSLQKHCVIESGHMQILGYTLTQLLADPETNIANLINVLIGRGGNLNMSQLLDLLSSCQQFRPIDKEDCTFLMNRLDKNSPESPMARYIQTKQKIFSPAYLQSVYDTACCQQKYHYIAKLLAKNPDVQVNATHAECKSHLPCPGVKLISADAMDKYYHESLCRSLHACARGKCRHWRSDDVCVKASEAPIVGVS